MDGVRFFAFILGVPLKNKKAKKEVYRQSEKTGKLSNLESGLWLRKENKVTIFFGCAFY